MGLPTLMHRNIGGVLLFSSFEGSISEQETKEMGCLKEVQILQLVKHCHKD